jgi:hypothetical protein
VSACPTKPEQYGSKIDSFGCKNTANDTVSNNEILEKNRKTKEFVSQFEPSFPLLSKKWFIRRGVWLAKIDHGQCTRKLSIKR